MIEINHRGLELNICERFKPGKKGCLFFIHGLGCSKDSFKDVWNFNEFEDYSVLTFDMPGFGDSSKPSDFSYSMQDQAEVCRQIIEKLRIDKIHLIVHSMGGAVGLILSSMIYDRLESFINLEGNLLSTDCTISRKASGRSQEAFESVVYDKMKQDLAILAGKDVSGAADVALWLKWLSKTPAHVFYRSARSLIQWSDSGKLFETFIALEKRTYYVFGEKNRDIPSVSKLRENNQQLVSIPSAGHFMMLNSGVFYPELARMIRGG